MDSGDEKARRHTGRCAERCLRFVERRHRDLLIVPLVLVCKVFGYVYVTQELVIPPEEPVVQLLSAVGHALFALFFASWLGVVLVGPGRVPKAVASGSKLPAGARDALEVGRWGKKRKFDAKDGWCDRCDRWKPVLAHHCSICDCCCLWMDHHCNFAGQCIGFRNLKCFVLFLFYGTGLFAFLLVVLLRRWTLPPSDYYIIARLVTFSVGLAGFSHTLFVNAHGLVWRLLSGWPSWVLMDKFYGILEVALELDGGGPDGELRAAVERVQWPSKIPHSIWAAGLRECLTLVFGGPPSWRWCLPTPGGTGDPLRPRRCDEGACAAWVALGELLDHARRAEDEAAAEAADGPFIAARRAAPGPEPQVVGGSAG